MPVEKETQPSVTQPQVGEQLCCMNREDSFDRLVLDDDAIIHEHVDSISGVDTNLSVLNWKWHLTFHFETS